MSTNDLGRNQSPAKHSTNAFAMLKKTAVDDEPPSPKPEEKAAPAKKANAAPKTAPKARPERAETSHKDKQSNGGVKRPIEPSSPESVGEAKERPTELVTLYLPLDLRESFKNQAKAEKATHPMLAFTAIEASYPYLEELLSQHVSGPSKTPQVSLFQRSGSQSRGRTTHTKDYGDLQFRITKTNASILDGLVDQFGAPSRSILITTAIRHYLDYPITDDE